MILDLFMDFNGENKDQLMYIINELKNKSFNRRLFMSAWNPLQLDDMVLPPCHVSYHFIPYLKNENYTVDLMMYLHRCIYIDVSTFCRCYTWITI